MRCIVIGAVLFGAVGVARADEDMEVGVKALVAEQAEALLDQPTKHRAFADTFTTDGLALLGPRAASGRDAIASALADSGLRGGDLSEITAAKPTRVAIGSLDDDAGYASADLAISAGKKKWTLRLSELVVRDGDHWSAKVAQLAVVTADKVATAWAKKSASQREAPDEIPGATDDDSSLATSPKELGAWLGSSNGMAVLGSAPKDVAVGSRKAKKLLAKWKKLKLAVVGKVLRVTPDNVMWGYVVANVELTAGKVKIPMRALIILGPAEGGYSTECVHYAFTGDPGLD